MKHDEADRQGFLGPRATEAFRNATIGIVGISGGGSHVAQQLVHLGFTDFALFDPKAMEAKHLHRLIGSTQEDVDRRTPKVEILRRLIHGVRPNARVVPVHNRWQEHPEILRGCDLVFGCVDTFQARHELEVETRRYLIPYIDIGMDVLPPARTFGHRMVGQVLLSMPGAPCMRCMGFLQGELLDREAQEYGAAGGGQQVVYPNGILASAAIGMAVDIMSAWSGKAPCPYLRLDGNGLELIADPRAEFWCDVPCTHFPLNELGPPRSQSILVPRSSVRARPVHLEVPGAEGRELESEPLPPPSSIQ